MQAIRTRYLCPTNTLGARIVAECEAKREVYPYDYSLDVVDNHRVAADELRKDLGWNALIGGGSLPGGGYAWLPGFCQDKEVRS